MLASLYWFIKKILPFRFLLIRVLDLHLFEWYIKIKKQWLPIVASKFVNKLDEEWFIVILSETQCKSYQTKPQCKHDVLSETTEMPKYFSVVKQKTILWFPNPDAHTNTFVQLFYVLFRKWTSYNSHTRTRKRQCFYVVRVTGLPKSIST